MSLTKCVAGRWLLGIFVFLMCVRSLLAQQGPPTPQLLSIFPAGAPSGSRTFVKILDQSELEFADRLIFSHPGIQAVPAKREVNRYFPNPTRLRHQFDVTIAADVPAGTYEVRAVCAYGVSNARRFVISSSRESIEAEPNDSFDKANSIELDSIVNGVFESGYDIYEFVSRSKEQVVIRCVSEQIDSNGDPVLTVFDESQKLLAKNQDTVGKDAMVSFKPEVGKTYFIRVHDLTFGSQGGNGRGKAVYRLSVDRKPWIDFVDPPVVTRGEPARVRLYGRNLGEQISEYRKGGTPLETVEVTIEPTPNRETDYSEMVRKPNEFLGRQFNYRYRNPLGESNPVPLLVVDGAFQREESLPLVNGTTDRQLASSATILGQFNQTGEVDGYRLTAAKGEQLRIELISQRFGIPVDPFVSIQVIEQDSNAKESYRQVTTFDDLRLMERPFLLPISSEDPSIVFTVPKDGDYRIQISDQFSLTPNYNGPNFYLLRVNETSPSARIVAIAGLERGQNENHSRPLRVSPCIVRQNSAAEIQLFVYRSPAFDHDIQVRATNLPRGISSEPTVVGSNQNHATLILRGGDQFDAEFAEIKLSATAVAESGDQFDVPIVPAEITTNPIGNRGPSEARLTNGIFIGLDDTITFPGTIALNKTEFETAVGGKIETAAQLVQTAQNKGAVQQAFVYGLPRTVSKSTNTIPDNGKEVTFRIDFRQNSPPGKYTSFIRGYQEKDVARFQKQYEQLAAEQKRMVAIQREVDREYQTAQQKRSRISQEINQNKQAISQLDEQIRLVRTQKTQLTKQIQSSTKNRELAETQLARAESTIKSLSEQFELQSDESKSQQLTTQLEGVRSEVTNHRQRLSEHKQAVASTQTKMDSISARLEHMEKKQADANEAFQQLAKELEECQSQVELLLRERTLGQEIKREVDQDVRLAQNASRPRRRRFLVHSNPIHISVSALPVDLTIQPLKLLLQQGEATDLKINVERKFGFEGPIDLSVLPQNGATGWSIAEPRINEIEPMVIRTFSVAENASVGKFTGSVRIRLRHGSATLSKTFPISVEVVAK